MTKHFCDACGAELSTNEIWGGPSAKAVAAGPSRADIRIRVTVQNGWVLCHACIRKAVAPKEE